jgi:NAD(P)-dependent dehydrogenase (short-subunit alcohol dehydrogenase family)
MADDRFSGKVALVTGAGSGIGRATALAFADAGARVVVADRDLDSAGAVCHELGDRECLPLRVDVADVDDVARMADAVIERFGQLDCAFNNAGIIHPARDLHEQEVTDWDRVFAVNVRGIFLSMKWEIPLLLAGGGGSIVNGASTLGLVGTAQQSIYSASKHAVVGLTRSAALDYARRGIRINAIAPGSVDTPLARNTDPEKMREYREAHPTGRIARPEEIAAGVLFLAGDESSNITGAVLNSDGGYTAR